VNDHDLDFFDQIELLEIGAEMTKSDLYHHTWIGGVLAVAAVVSFTVLSDVTGAALMFNLSAVGAVFFLIFRAFIPVVFSALNKVSNEEMVKNTERHPIGSYFYIEDD
jgi:hypothetical protein